MLQIIFYQKNFNDIDIQGDLKYFKAERVSYNFLLRYDVAKQLSKNGSASIRHYARSAIINGTTCPNDVRGGYASINTARIFMTRSVNYAALISNDATRRILLRSSNRICVRYRSRVNILLLRSRLRRSKW
jgi:hypothetical protein